MIRNKITGAFKIISLSLKTIFTFDSNQIFLLPMWLKTFRKSGEPIKDHIPRLSLGAIAWLNSYLDKRKEVFEYGSGGSTFFFAKKAKKVVSVEHDLYWYKTVLSELKKNNIKNCECFLVKPQKNRTNSGKYASHIKEYRNMNFRDYVNKIKKYSPGGFDLILIDGRARVSCIPEALKMIKNKGYIMFDNAEREEYSAGLGLLSKYKRNDFFGPSPYLSNNFVKTSIWEIAK